jgi:exopolysaccharide biosynthesis polyprenyl glycosylphosphotransferase
MDEPLSHPDRPAQEGATAPPPEPVVAGRTPGRLLTALGVLPGPIGGALTAGACAVSYGTPVESSFVTFVGLLVAGAIADRRSRWAPLLPFMGVISRVAGPLLGVCLLALLEILTTLPGLGDKGIAAVGVAASVATLAGEVLAQRLRHPDRRVRVAVIGGPVAADSLARELAGARTVDYHIAGRIRPPAMRGGDGLDTPTLGDLDHLGPIVEEHGIDLLLMTAEVPRLAVFEEISRSCLHLPVRLQELAGFYEDTFGHVPVAEINAAWFQYIMHPRYRHSSPFAQRALDVVISTVALAVLVPFLALLALVIRRDGGPALFRQERIGDKGRPFTIWKLRTMRVNAAVAWAGADDARVTRIGRFLRKTHIDELPQLVNILLGEMSLIGPRPEQPAFVERLEGTVPFYSRRHLVKPGLTGWAQVRCGYAGSDIGSAWKVSHDLFYLKHKSFWLNLMILGETLRTLVADRQYTAEPSTVAFILRAQETGEQQAIKASSAKTATTSDWAAAASAPISVREA